MRGPASEYLFDTRHDRYPVASHLVLRDPDGRILLMKRAGTVYGEGQYGFPAGHVDLGETPTQSIIRETAEELGITIAPASLAPAGVMFRLSLEPRVDFLFRGRVGRHPADLRAAQVHRNRLGRPGRPAARHPGIHQRSHLQPAPRPPLQRARLG